MASSNPGCLVRILEQGTSAAAALCWLCVVLAFVLPPVFFLLDGPPERRSLNFPADLDPDALEFTAEGPAGTWSIRPTEAQINAPDDTWWKGPLVLASIFAIFAFVLTHMARMFRTLRNGHPFIPENAHRLRRIGQGVLVFEALKWVLTTALLAPSFRSLEGEYTFRAGSGLDLGNIFVALCVLVFAEVFRRGTEMQAEQDLTV